MEARRTYMANYYINKRNYILGLSNKSKEDLTDKEVRDLNKYIMKFRPKSGKALRFRPGPIDKGEKIKGLKIDCRKVLVTFD